MLAWMHAHVLGAVALAWAVGCVVGGSFGMLLMAWLVASREADVYEIGCSPEKRG